MDESVSLEDDYFNIESTESIEVCHDLIEPSVIVEDVLYGIHKPYRVIIRAKISHDQD